jgi:PAS domain S-box-containing protein
MAQLAVLGFSWGALRTVNATRAYATGESLYSKASNAAVLSLYRYAKTGDEVYWNEFRTALDVPFGDRMAREELDRKAPDYGRAVAGFLRGQNSIDDIPYAIRVFRWFRKWAPFEAAVANWRRGDETLERIDAVASELHALYRNAMLTEPARQRIIAEIDTLNLRLTALQIKFSAHIASAARSATLLVTLMLCVASMLLWSIGVAFAWRTYRKGIAAEVQVRESEERFRNFAEVASDWFWETDRDLRITYLSERFATATGISPRDILGRRAREAGLWAVGDSEDSQPVKTVPARSTFRGYTHRYIQENGEEQFWQISGLPVFAANGRVIGYRGTGTNVTEEIRAAQALREAKLQSDSANRTKSEFLANMSHELRTPLNAILGFSEIIKGEVFGKGSDKYTEYAEDIFNSGTFLLALIDNLLDLAKIEAGRMQLYEEPIEIVCLVESTTELLRQRVQAAKLNLIMELSTGLPPIKVDPLKLQQILLNLLSNAIKFTPAGGSVSITVRRDPDANLEIVVQDTGIGIPPDKISQALEPFGQVENSVTRSHAGTGLGLPLVKALTELHGGTLSLTSEVDRGTMVVVALPHERFIAEAATSAASQRVLGGK